VSRNALSGSTHPRATTPGVSDSKSGSSATNMLGCACLSRTKTDKNRDQRKARVHSLAARIDGGWQLVLLAQGAQSWIPVYRSQ
jgi:hypothetical protein